MDRQQQQEDFSLAIVRGIAATAGLGCDRPDRDTGFDFTVSPKGLDPAARLARLDVQVKSTCVPDDRHDHYRYRLDRRYYDLLRPSQFHTDAVLVLVIVPEAVDAWLHMSDMRIVLQHCAYWVSLAGLGPMPNRTKVPVIVPKAQQFTPAALREMMERIALGGHP